MAHFKNPMEVFQLLDKSNCRKCNRPTCLAFAADVFQGQKQLQECPKLGDAVIKKCGTGTAPPSANDQDIEAQVMQLKKQIQTKDLAAAADMLGGTFKNSKLTLKILGKDFHIDSEGNLSSDIHIHPWVTIPILVYVLGGKGTPASGKWVPFRELKNGSSWNSLFVQRCEKPLKRVADSYTELFEDMIQLFRGKPLDAPSAADISLVLHPLPKVPMLICYWKPEDGMSSSLHIFFDASVDDNLNIESVFGLGTGLVRMFEKIALRHGFENRFGFNRGSGR
jgi:hypothetical protein